jgi:uncharacterized membrane protein
MLATYVEHYHDGWFWFGPWFWIPLWILLFFLIRGLFWRRYRRYHHDGPWGGYGHWRGGESDPRVILAQRYARGEISEQEYTERMAVLNTPRTQ